jgi:quinol monooxygenase YgiN
MSLPVLIAFAGVLVAAVATGLLAGRCVRRPRIDFILWTAATLALTVALAAQSMGFAHGFDPATFRAVQLFALLLAPLWLAWGLAELVWPSESARFGARLIGGTLTVVGGVIVATDPLSGQPFGKSWPLVSAHYQPVAHDALDLVQAVAVIVAVVSVGLAVARNRRWAGALPGVVSVGLAVLLIVGLRFSLPARSVYPLVSMVAAVLVWFGASRIRPGPEDAPDVQRAANGHYRPAGAEDPGDLTEFRGSLGPVAPRSPAAPRGPGAPYPGRNAAAPSQPGGGSLIRGPGNLAEPGWRLDPRPRQPAPLAPYQTQPARPAGAAAAAAGVAAARTVTAAGGEEPAGSPAATPAKPYGRILIFTLLEDRVAEFDRLAEQTAEEVRTGEPDTLVYVIHLVPNAPLQRIFYEIYRDRAAFDSHESQPYTQRFVAERRPYVLATNVIELRLKYAKVAPLSGPTQRAQGGHRGPQVLEPLPPGPDPRLPSAGRRYGGI